LPGSMQYLNSIADGHWAAKGALNLALLDGAAKAARQPLYDYLGLGFTEGRHLTSFSIGIDTPDVIRQKVQEAEAYPILKLKVGVARDRENLAALRAVAPKKIVRVDANEAWKTKEDALRQLELLAQDPNIELVEQPMPADTPESDLAWLKERTPLPLMADEAYRSADDLKRCAGLYHAVNVKLVKTGGLTAGLAALRAARQAGMKTMLGCMIESSVLISAAAHLAELTDYLDIDGNLLIRNDPYTGVSGRNGRISFEPARARLGLCVQPR
jgi:L-alanine-DL-glutamate epimerase-like enolase superfamily enzyme